jgi:glucose-1-phosphate cytidylyltransferase
VTGVSPPGRFGELTVEGDLVRTFSEKPPGGLVNGGFFVFEPSFFDYLSDDRECVLEHEPLERLAQYGKLGVHRHAGFWQPVDTPSDYAHVTGLWCAGRAPWRTWT